MNIELKATEVVVKKSGEYNQVMAFLEDVELEEILNIVMGLDWEYQQQLIEDLKENLEKIKR